MKRIGIARLLGDLSVGEGALERLGQRLEQIGDELLELASGESDKQALRN